MVLGYWALALPVYAAALATAITIPRTTAIATASCLIAVEPGAFDFTRGPSLLLYQGPPDIFQNLPLTMAPAEIVLLASGMGMLMVVRSDPSSRAVPPLLWGVPAVVALGLLYGLARGGELNLAYHEMRGILFGIAAFVVAPAAGAKYQRLAFGLFLIAVGFLGVTTILRYTMYVKFGTLPVPPEVAFSHDSVIYLALAIGLSSFLLLRRAPSANRWFLLALILISFAAILATGRRSGTLVMLIGMISLLLFALPRRPILLSYLAIVLTTIGVVYVAAYWNTPYGALAQPARAIRSQIDPSPRDEASDMYRDIEQYNLTQTIRDSSLLGIGFGRPFVQYQGLPDLTSFWPLQFYTPHQNILWLWLKVGLLGISVILAAFSVALRRCLTVLHAKATMDDTWQTAAIVASGLLMFITFATVDVIFPATRGMVVLGVLFALACGLETGARRGEPG